jgi:hypothetical protein
VVEGEGGILLGEGLIGVFIDTQTFSVPTSSLTRPSVQTELDLHARRQMKKKDRKGMEKEMLYLSIKRFSSKRKRKHGSFGQHSVVTVSVIENKIFFLL